MQYKNITKILIDKRKLDTLLRLGCQESIIWEYIKTGEIQYTGDALIDDNLESLIDVRAFKNWGGNHNPTGKNQYTKNNVANASKCYQVLPNATITKNQESGQVDHQVDQAVDLGQEVGQVVDIDIDRDIYNNNIYNINTKEKENILKEKEIPTSNSGFGCKTITENAEQEESIVIQDSIFTQDNNTPLENNNTVNARQENEYNGKESKSSDISREKAIVNWNRIANDYNLPEIKTITETRFTKLKARVKQAGGWVEFWNIVNDAIRESSFLRGAKGWRADFDFCLQPSSFVKLMEKTYK